MLVVRLLSFVCKNLECLTCKKRCPDLEVRNNESPDHCHNESERSAQTDKELGETRTENSQLS